MPDKTACLLCGRGFERRGPGGTRRYCEECRGRAAEQAAMVLRVHCKECGGEFSTHKRSVRYCSDECRKRGCKRLRCASRAKAGQAASSSPASASPAAAAAGGGGPAQERRCRSCGKGFVPDWKPGKPRAYCSEGCRTDGRRRLYREAMRRYCADPEKRAIKAARGNAAAAARRRARGDKGEGR